MPRSRTRSPLAVGWPRPRQPFPCATCHIHIPAEALSLSLALLSPRRPSLSRRRSRLSYIFSVHRPSDDHSAYTQLSLTSLINMSLATSHDNIILVAPRPVRLAAPATHYSHYHSSFLNRPQPTKATVRLVAAPTDAFERMKLSSNDAGDEDLPPPSAERDRPLSPRASPRCVHLFYSDSLILGNRLCTFYLRQFWCVRLGTFR